MAAAGAGGGPVLTPAPPPPQPVHIKTTIVAAVRPSHVGCLARPAIIPRTVTMRKVARSRPSQGELKRNRKETGSAGIDSWTGGTKATAVVAALIVDVTGDGPVNGKVEGRCVQIAPVGALALVCATVPAEYPSAM